jgi:hypothetical protein
LFAAGSTAAAAPSCDDNWRTDRRSTKPGIVFEAGIDGFQVGQPAPAEVLQKIGPLLCAAGTEELRVANVHRQPPRADPTRYAERTIRLEQFIRGREVRLAFVFIRLNIETNEVLMINANFLPDRGIDHLPRLPPGQAKAKAAAQMPWALDQHLGSAARKFRFDDHPAHLAYEIEEAGFAPVRGVLVWVFSVYVESDGWYQVHVDASTGKIVALFGYFT